MTRGPAGVRFDHVLWMGLVVLGRILCVFGAIGMLYLIAALAMAERGRFDG